MRWMMKLPNFKRLLNSHLLFYGKTCIRTMWWMSVPLHFSTKSGQSKLQKPCGRVKNTPVHWIRHLNHKKRRLHRDINAQPLGRWNPDSVQGPSAILPLCLRCSELTPLYKIQEVMQMQTGFDWKRVSCGSLHCEESIFGMAWGG